MGLPDGSPIRWCRRGFPQADLRFRNQRWAGAVGLGALTDAAWIGHFGRFEPLPGNLPQPLALRYHGHQFRVYNPDIGDGRGFLFAQLRDARRKICQAGRADGCSISAPRDPARRRGAARVTAG